MGKCAHHQSVYGSVHLTRPRDCSRPVMLVGFQRMDNLGLGYLSSTLRSCGYPVLTYDFQDDPDTIIAAAQSRNPLLLGFSLIFEFYLRRFQALARLLRNSNVACHFTVGGHFPTLGYEQTLSAIPELDSLVRGEGELTLLELADLLSLCQDWRSVSGIAYRNHEEIIVNAPRPLIANLDVLPYPDRPAELKAIVGQSVAPILASRGCPRSCAFCSIRTFYSSSPGALVRTRNPAELVKEMQMLHSERGATVFLFQDDEFQLWCAAARDWTRCFLRGLHEAGLSRRILWKISCRADDVDVELFRQMRDAGLFFVYLGLESGHQEGLKVLGKQTTVAQNMRAVSILKDLDLGLGYGFMMFEPCSTLESIRQNVGFLRDIVADGSAAVTFCRMFAYEGTPIKRGLVRSGRLHGGIGDPYYDFLDTRVQRCFETLTTIVDLKEWIGGSALLPVYVNSALTEVSVVRRLLPPVRDLQSYSETVRQIARESNAFILQVVEDISYRVSDDRHYEWTKETISANCRRYLERLRAARNEFLEQNHGLLISLVLGSDGDGQYAGPAPQSFSQCA